MALFGSIGGSSSSSESQSTSQSTANSFVDPSQQPFLDFLRNAGVNATANVIGRDQGLFKTSADLLGQGKDFLGQLAGAGSGLVGFGGQELVDTQISQLGADIGDFFQNQIIPGISRDATAVGALGGGRDEVARGAAAGEALDAFSRGSVDIQRGAEAQRLQAGIAAEGFATEASLGGLSSLAQLFGIAQAPFAAQLDPLVQLAGILGGPTVLQQSQSSSQSTSESDSSSFSVGF